MKRKGGYVYGSIYERKRKDKDSISYVAEIHFQGQTMRRSLKDRKVLSVWMDNVCEQLNSLLDEYNDKLAFEVMNIKNKLYANMIERADNTTEAVKMLLAIEKAEAENLMAFANYEEWVKMGLAIASTFGEDGRVMFHRLSALCPEKYDEAAADTKYNNLIASASTLPSATVASVYWQLSEARRAKSVEEDFSNFNYGEDNNEEDV